MPLTGAEAAEQLDSGTIDVAIAHLRTLPAHLDSMILLRDPFVVIARRGHPLCGQSPAIEAYAALNHVLVSPRGDTSGAVDRALADLGLKRRIALLVATYLALPAALSASDLVATVPQRTARQIAATADIEIMPLAFDLSVPVSMAWHRRAASEPAQVWFRSLLVQAVRD
jgi:DNA-binding transcriptional LysR family regulator